jgi:hypothetical protein
MWLKPKEGIQWNPTVWLALNLGPRIPKYWKHKYLGLHPLLDNLQHIFSSVKPCRLAALVELEAFSGKSTHEMPSFWFVLDLGPWLFLWHNSAPWHGLKLPFASYPSIKCLSSPFLTWSRLISLQGHESRAIILCWWKNNTNLLQE